MVSYSYLFLTENLFLIIRKSDQRVLNFIYSFVCLFPPTFTLSEDENCIRHKYMSTQYALLISWDLDDLGVDSVHEEILGLT